MSMKPSQAHPEEPPPPVFRTWPAVYAFVLIVSFIVFLLLLWLSLSYS